jgi:hypothetical protein
MDNQFDSTKYPDAVPAELTAGARWAWTRSDITNAYPTASYTLSFRFRELASPYTQQTITAGKVSSAHVVTVAIADTASAYVAGDYSWQAIITRDSDGEQVQVDQGLVTILPDITGAGTSASWVYRVLMAVRATIEGTASKEQSAYSIGGRSLSLRSVAELLELEKDFARRWRDEKNAIDRNAGRTSGSRVLVKMSA